MTDQQDNTKVGTICGAVCFCAALIAMMYGCQLSYSDCRPRITQPQPEHNALKELGEEHQRWTRM